MHGRRASDYSSHMSSYDERESPEKQTIVEEESVGDGQLQPPTELFKGQDLPRSDTPETYLSDIADKPDISLFCDQCRFFVDIRQLKHHRAYHNALQILHYKGNQLPDTSELLLKKRNAVLRKMKKEATEENPIEPKHIQQVNDAYELLKSDLEDTFEACRQVRDTVDVSCRATALNCSPSCVYALGMCSSPNSKWKSEMEDTKVYQDGFGENKNKCYLGLFDGYHGRFSAEVAAGLLHKMLLHELMKFDDSLALGPKKEYEEDTDISHHRFVFGSAGSLDGQAVTGKEAAEDASGSGKSDTAFTIQPEDSELTQRIIQLCEEKYEKLLEEMSSPPTPKTPHSLSSRTERARHPWEDKIGQAFDKSYQLLDILLSYGKDEYSNVRWSGCSALSLVIESSTKTAEDGQASSSRLNTDRNNKNTPRTAEPPQEMGFVHLANAGNARVLLVRGNKSYRLSKDHTPANTKERDRVVRQGGTVNTSEADCRVNGVLSTTRGLGNHGDPGLKKCVLVEPHTCSVQIDQYAQFIVMATSGVWEILSDQDVASLLMRMLPSNHIPAPRKPSTSLDDLLTHRHLDTRNTDTASVSKRLDGGGQEAAGSKPDADIGNEKGAKDAGMSEKTHTSVADTDDVLKIQADLKTEAGSHFGDAEDSSLSLPGDQDMVALPVHSRLQLGGQRSVEDQRRELAQSMAECLVQAALLAGSRNNISVMVALLPGCGV